MHIAAFENGRPDRYPSICRAANAKGCMNAKASSKITWVDVRLSCVNVCRTFRLCLSDVKVYRTFRNSIKAAFEEII